MGGVGGVSHVHVTNVYGACGVCVGDVLISKRIHELRKILMWQLNKIRRLLF